MSEYTAEDFKNARFAEHGHGAKAVRWGENYRFPWHTATGDRFSHEQMAENGWRPVHERDLGETRKLRADNEALCDEVEELTHRLSARERTIAALRELAPLTLDTLREAWENAEVPTKGSLTREGDVVIEKSNDHDFGVFEATKSLVGISVGVRILHRAPQPEPWQALADEMEELYDGDSVRAGEAAEFLHERGVRVTGGDDT